MMTPYQVLETTCKLLDRGGLDRRAKLETAGRLTYEMKKDPLLLEQFPVERIQYCARGLFSDNDTSIRTAALRVLRYSMINSSSIANALMLGVQLFVSRSMERDAKLVGERIQALKVARRLLEIDGTQMPSCLCRSIVAIANHKEDNLRRVALESLRELAIVNVQVVIQCNGFKTLVDSILDPTCQDLADALLLTLLYLVNEPANRDYIHSFIDAQVLLAPFTDTDAPAGTERRQRWSASRNAIVMMMRSWTGILLLTSNPQGLKSLIQLLVQPVGDDVQKAVLATICEIFYKPTSLDKSGNEVVTPNEPIPIEDKAAASTTGYNNLLDNYMTMVLLSFLHCGVIDALITLGTSLNRSLAEPALELLSDFLRISARLLPDQHCTNLLALPQLVTTTALSSSMPPTETKQRELAIRSGEMLAELALVVGGNANAQRALAASSGASNAPINGVHLASELLRGTNRPVQNFSTASLLREATATSREVLVHSLKVQMDNQMDDHTFREMLMTKCRVLNGKDWYRWNWDVISELLEGPLTNPSRLSEAMKTKFFKRVSGFFRCDNSDKGYFAGLPWTPDYVPYLRPACQMYMLLLNHPEGLSFLKTDRRGQLLTEIASALELEARPEAAIVESHLGDLQARMFSPEYCSRRMLREYFTLLGLMSSSTEGLKMMEKSGLFARLTKMGQAAKGGNSHMLPNFGELTKMQRAEKEKTQGHDFLCRLILANLDYTVEGSSRQLLQDWMTTGSESLRLYATCLLRALLRSEVGDFAKWGIDSLVAQLHQEPSVARAALSVLEEAAETPEYLLAIIQKKPLQLVHMQAESLLLKCLSLPEGLAFLREVTNWIPASLLSWRQHKQWAYVHLVETQLTRGLFRDKQPPTSSMGNKYQKPKPIAIPVTVPSRRSSNFKQGAHRGQWGLEWLFRMPWNMEVKIVGPPGSGPPAHLTIDTYVDASEPEDSLDGHRMNTIRIKGVVVDARNSPKPMTVNSQQTLQACLFLGAQPVDRKGYTKPAPQSNGGFLMAPASEKDPKSDPTARTRAVSTSTDRLSEHTSLADAYEPTDENKDWSSCGPEQRSTQTLLANAVAVTENERVATLCPPGERALWTFDLETDHSQANLKRVQLKSVEFTIQLLPSKASTVPLPPHLYGELAKTKDGIVLLQQSGYVTELVVAVKDAATAPLERRAALWAVGHIAATTRGLELLLSVAEDLLDVIVDMATSATMLSLRGTCFFVLGIIARSAPGKRALAKYGWDTPRDARAMIAVPSKPETLFAWPAGTPPSPASMVDLKASFEAPSYKAAPRGKEILRLVGDLSSHITQKEAGAALNRMKNMYPDLFEDTALALSAHTLLSRYHYRLTARQFVFNLFEKADLTNAALDIHLHKPTPVATRRRSSVSAPSLSSTIQSLQHTHAKETIVATSRPMLDQESTIFVGAQQAMV
ncbi:hypothetical protein SPRG_13413 [Saprolegnia parasitica CBS 223.65]|uniref:Rapamycin-insensitive companion of mTOR domain-containing protein n=1 Tax=Saprolegnia parasitica (strain CBS 223.65) TaxID=695850 RepID=A0A067BV09_SAPPC|nr:hypothetical protein SPRG_13413 [Saprolegnia parasitica CBS 223.65]KDO20660.1 hypothetical protein SPRG_13413 [Saprolegnia parasitica CBS 223.65]|eukprot:XP_012208626.1 hypothetical protein SPRG_13413 [Saprolegnia parasitica CBS 223.65]